MNEIDTGFFIETEFLKWWNSMGSFKLYDFLETLIKYRSHLRNVIYSHRTQYNDVFRFFK